MAHTFNVIPAKPAFGVVKESMYQSDYINRLKYKNTICDKSSCYNKSYYQYNQNKQLINTQCDLPFNKTNLESNLFTKQDLQDVCIITENGPTCNTQPCNTAYNYDATKPFYYNYTIDPCGELFGNTPCGINNFTNFTIINKP
jgi:hypothetical protein